MVKELIAAGLNGDALVQEVMRQTGLSAGDASALIAVETGEAKGDTEPPASGSITDLRKKTAAA